MKIYTNFEFYRHQKPTSADMVQITRLVRAQRQEALLKNGTFLTFQAALLLEKYSNWDQLQAFKQRCLGFAHEEIMACFMKVLDEGLSPLQIGHYEREIERKKRLFPLFSWSGSVMFSDHAKKCEFIIDSLLKDGMSLSIETAIYLICKEFKGSEQASSRFVDKYLEAFGLFVDEKMGSMNADMKLYSKKRKYSAI